MIPREGSIRIQQHSNRLNARLRRINIRSRRIFHKIVVLRTETDSLVCQTRRNSKYRGKIRFGESAAFKRVEDQRITGNLLEFRVFLGGNFVRTLPAE